MNIEELAFKDRAELAHLNGIDLLNIIEFLQKDRQQWINQFSKTHNESVDIQRENQELKKHLEVPETCNLKTLEDYKRYYEDTTKEQILADTYIEYCAYVNLAHRYSELKKQLENNLKINVADHKYASDCEDKVIILETQKKEFIKYLEDEIKELQKIKETELDYDILQDVISQLLVFEDVLQKYKETIEPYQKRINELEKKLYYRTQDMEALYLAGKELINSIDKDYLEVIINIDELKAYFKLPELTEMTIKKIAIPIKQDLLENYMYWINYYKSKYELGGK